MKQKEDCSKEWWAEIREQEEIKKDLKQCCHLSIQSGFESIIQNEIGTEVALRFSLNYCPNCGRALNSEKPAIESRGCCYLLRDIGIESVQCKEKIFKEDGESDFIVHRLQITYCFNCGRKIPRITGDDSKGKGTKS